MRAQLERADLVVATSQGIRGELIEIAPTVAPSILVKPNTVDPDCFATTRKRDGGDGPLRLVSVSRFDPKKGRYVGSFVGSMMTYQWFYEGTLDESGKVLTLETEGPSMAGDGMAPYRDVITIVSPDQRILSSHTPDGNGGWTEFMTAHYRRKA